MPLNKLTPIFLSVVIASACTEHSAITDEPKNLSEKVPGSYRDLNANGELDIYEDDSREISERAVDILRRLTTEQKINMVSGLGFSVEERSRDIDKVPGAAGYTYPVKELGIPSLVLADGPAGLRIWPTRKNDEKTYYATAFPVETLLASSWDKELLGSVGRAMGNEIKEYGVDVFLAPGMNIHRNPLGGRNFEYYSEDPVLSGNMAAAMVNGVESVGVGATIKHFIANNQETNRILVDTKVSERALREIYLKGFEIAVKQSKPWSIMSSYNKINGVAASEHEKLLKNVLRDEWGFDGVVMTDWFAGYDTADQMKAGNELLMPGTDDGTARIRTAVESGELPIEDLDRNVTHILEMVLKSPAFHGYKYTEQPNLKENAEVARSAAAEGIVLLKNLDKTLPITDRSIRIAAFGTTSYDFIAGGTGSGDVNEAYTVSLVDGLANGGYEIDKSMAEIYQQYIVSEKNKLPEKKVFYELLPPIPEMPLSKDFLSKSVQENDIAFVTIGRNSGEFQDRTRAGDFDLTSEEKAMIKSVADAFHGAGKKVVVILNIGNVIETASWKNLADAIVLPWQGGQEAGNALVDVLSGKSSPSGKLPTTFPVSYDDVPSATTSRFPGVPVEGEVQRSVGGGILEAEPWRVDYEEGIFVGYRYYDKFNVLPSYEFGYGLSYTNFEYEKTTVSDSTFSNSISFELNVRNSGDYAGKEVVQIYLSAPEGGISKPTKELKSFQKTKLLKPGEMQSLKFTLNADDLASFDPERDAWVVAPGVYSIMVGASSKDIRAEMRFSVGAEIVTESGLVDLSSDWNPEVNF